jgi:hypothetical protein
MKKFKSFTSEDVTNRSAICDLSNEFCSTVFVEPRPFVCEEQSVINFAAFDPCCDLKSVELNTPMKSVEITAR